MHPCGGGLPQTAPRVSQRPGLTSDGSPYDSPGELLTPDQAAQMLKVTAGTLAKWRLSGAGPAFVKMGSRVFYHRGDLTAFISGRRRFSTSEQAA